MTVGFNPDVYVCPEESKVPLPRIYTRQGVSTIRKKWEKAWKARLGALSETVE